MPDTLEDREWAGVGSSSLQPPADYWETVDGNSDQLAKLGELLDSRHNEVRPAQLGQPAKSAHDLLDRFTADGWLQRELRRTCPNCGEQVLEDDSVQCPNCNQAFDDHGGVTEQTVYVRNLVPGRDVEWVVVIHGMNTSGAWQEEFSWYFATTWGRSVPVAVYKYGMVIAGVVMAWRRRTLQRRLRYKLAALNEQAQAQGFAWLPDVVAHSFGTWLLAHLLEDELERPEEERLRFGRVILAGCVIRPDFGWARVKAAGLVESVLNHYGTKDPIVPLAHYTILDSGPSGRRGFDGDEVINVRASGYGHSDVLSTSRCYSATENRLSKCGSEAGELTSLAHGYRRYWRPFLTLPISELDRISDRVDPARVWTEAPWPLRGTLFPVFALPLLAGLLLMTVRSIGAGWSAFGGWPAMIVAISGSGLGVLVLGVLANLAVRSITEWTSSK